MIAGLVVGSQIHSMAGEIAAACVVNIGMCFIWPVLEALVSEGANAARAVGIYNITWAATNASAYFIGGTLIVTFGYQSMFYLPLAFIVIQLALVFWLEKIHGAAVGEPGELLPHDANRPSPAQRQKFPAHGVAGESVRLHRHQHAARRHSRHRREISAVAHAGGICLLALVFCAARHVRRCCGTGRAGITGSAGW